MKWETRKLGELIHIKHSWAFKGEYFGNEGELIILTPGNFFEKGSFR
jgi:type I restriction enzyme S subunit